LKFLPLNKRKKIWLLKYSLEENKRDKNNIGSHFAILFCDELWRQQKMALAAITHFLLKEIISLLDFVGLFLQLFLNARALVSHDLRLFLCWLCKGGSHWI